MSVFNLDGIIKALEETQINIEKVRGISFEGQNLKLDTAEDAKPLVDAITTCEQLEYLNLAGNTLGVAASESVAKALEKHPEFKRALWKDLFTGRLKDEIPKSLKFLGEGLVKADARLTELDLSDNAFGPIGVKGLAALLSSSSCFNLKELRLNNNGLGVSGGKLLAAALMDCYNCSKTKQGASPLALKVFIAGRNRLENEGAKALAHVFETIGTFEEISMPQNGIYHVGITALSEAFATNTELRVLNLNDNTIGPRGSASLARALPHLRQLRTINLGDCLLKTKGAVSIAGALGDNGQLEELVLDYNEIRVEGALAIARAVADKPNLRLLMLDGNHFGTRGRRDLRNALGAPDSRAATALATLEADESDNDDDSEQQQQQEEEEEEEDEQAEDDDDEEEEEAGADDVADEPDERTTGEEADQPARALGTVQDFLECPTAERFMELAEDDGLATLLTEAKGELSEDKFLDRYIPVLMKVCALAGSSQTVVSRRALDYSDAMFDQLFQWHSDTHHTVPLINNALLVHLGLIKSEDKKWRPAWDLEGCMVALEAALRRDYFPQATRDTMHVFMCKRGSP